MRRDDGGGRVTGRQRLRVAVIGGGQNCEHEVGLATARSVAAALDPRRHDVVSLTIGLDGRWRDAAGAEFADGLAGALAVITGCDVVFPAVHGPHGEDGSLAALCELAAVPYVGSGVRAGALAMDKWATKLVAEALGIRTAHGVLLSSADGPLPHWGPAVVKPVAAGSSHGVTLVREPAGLAAAVTAALEYDDRVLVEEVVTGREIDVAVLETPGGGRRIGPPLEIVVEARRLFDTAAKYDGSADFRLPADVTDLERACLDEAALALFEALGCAGVARFDFFLTAAGPVLNEVNTMPGMTAESQVPKMFSADGLPYPRLLEALLEVALKNVHGAPADGA
jgi:D-alanine-D-alanine ligase